MKRPIVWILACLAWGCADSEGSGDVNAETGGAGGMTGAACHPTESMSVYLTADGVHVREDLEFVATVTHVSNDAAVLETCPNGEEGGAGSGGASSCSEQALRLEIRAPELAPPVSVGRNVQVDWAWRSAGFASSTVAVVLRDVGDSSIGGILLGATAGIELGNMPVEVESEDLGCVFDPPAALCGSIIAYALVMTATQNPSSTVRLTMGETRTLALEPTSDETWRVRNVRSYATGNCDDYATNWWYLVRED